MRTVEAFQKLPEDAGPVYHELQHGEIVAVTKPKLKHYLLQIRIRPPMESTAGDAGVIVTRFTFRPVGQEIPLPLFGDAAVAVDAILG